MDPNKAFASGGLEVNDRPGLSGSKKAKTGVAQIGGFKNPSNGPGNKTPVYSGPSQADIAAQKAAAQKKAQNDKLRKGFAKQKQGIFTTAGEAAGTTALKLRGGIADLVSSLEGGQSKIDQRQINNELARRQGSRGILDMIGRGIRSGGITLANKNATDSSAAQAIARAYGDIGRREQGDLLNDFGQESTEIGLLQEDLERQRAGGIRDLEEDRVLGIRRIMSSARQSLQALDAAMLDSDLPERVAIEQEKSRIKQRTLDKLGKFEQLIRQRARSVQALDREGAREQAFARANEGVAAEVPYDYTAEAPGQLQGTGPFASELPIFTFRRPDEE